MSMPFHPFADLFPLIEGSEFDELVASIKENGQIETIILLEGAILDGRNRYRACLTANVEPRFEPFTGIDPLRFVACKNVHRRQLTAGQRALIAAEMARLRHGSNQFRKRENGKDDAAASSSITAVEAAHLMNVNRSTVRDAKIVLASGTAEEIAAVKNGTAGVRGIARQIEEHIEPDKRTKAREHSQHHREDSRNHTRERHAQIWAALGGALDGLTSLPLPADVAIIAYGQVSRRSTVNAKLSSAFQWLTEFSNAWNARSD